MASLRISSEEPITMCELRSSLEKIKKRDGELNFRANKTEEHLNNMSLLKTKEAEELQKKIAQLGIARFKPEHIVKVVDMLPRSMEELKIILSGYNITVNQENSKKIVDAVADYVKTQ